MQRTLPRVVLDSNIIKKVNKFYDCKLPGRYLYRSCFSAPELSDHRCNALAPVEGGKRCEHCGHVPGQACPVTCHIAKFCLAAYAYRLGIGGSSLDTALARNLNTSYEVLYSSVQRSKVRQNARSESSEPEVAQDLDRVEHEGNLRGFADAFTEVYTRVPREATEEPVKEEPEAVVAEEKVSEEVAQVEEEKPEVLEEDPQLPKPMFIPTFALPTVSSTPEEAPVPEFSEVPVSEKQSRIPDVKDENGEPLYTLPNAAKLVGISYNSLYEKVKRKQAEAIVIGKRSYMKKTEALRLAEERKCHTKTKES